MKKQDIIFISYSTKIWLCSAILSPFLRVVYLFLFQKLSYYNFIPLTLFPIMVGFYLSIPNYILLLVGTYFIFKQNKNAIKRRWWSQLLVTILWFLIFGLLFDYKSLFSLFLNFPISYLITLTIGVWGFKVSTSDKSDNSRLEIFDGNIEK